MSTKLLKWEHRHDASRLSLRLFAASMASCFPRSPVGRAALAWWRKKSPTRALLVERAGAEQIESMRRAEARLFDEPPPGHFIHDPEDGPEENEGQASAGGAP